MTDDPIPLEPAGRPDAPKGQAAPAGAPPASTPAPGPLELNAVELDITHQRVTLPPEQEAGRANWLKKVPNAEKTAAADTDVEQPHAPRVVPTPATPTRPRVAANEVASDEPFAAAPETLQPVMPSGIDQRYIRVGDNYYNQKNPSQLAFADQGNRLETPSNSPTMADELIRIAQARGWDEVKITGSETFRREAWLEAASRGLNVRGYTPNEVDLAHLAKRRQEANHGTDKTYSASTPAGEQPAPAAPAPSREKASTAPALPAKNERIAPDQADEAPVPKLNKPPAPESPARARARVFETQAPAEAVARHPQLAGVAAIEAAIEKRAQADGLSPAQRDAVVARARENIAKTLDAGRVPEVKVRDAAPTPPRDRRPQNEQEFTR